MDLRRRSGRRLIVALAAAVLVIAAVATALVAASRPVPVSARNLRIAVTDGPHDNQEVVLDATFFTPPGNGRVPAILLAHGFGETKNAVRLQAEQLARAGFAVLTWSARGFGRSTGQIALDSPDYEVKDVEQLVTWLARQPRVLLDRPGDPRAGIAGASYGGGIALLAVAYDHRIDAIVPQITWNNLATALFPDAAGGGPQYGVFKKQWAGLLFTQGSVGFRAGAGQAGPGQGGAGQGSAGQGSAGQQGPPGQAAIAHAVQCGRFLPQVCAVYRQVATLGQPTPQAISLLLRSSPASVASRIDVPTLLIQGKHDSLFGLDQADANYQAIRRNGAPVDMVWFAGGHDGGNQEAGRVNALTEHWFDRWLKPPNQPFRPVAGGSQGTSGGGTGGAASTSTSAATGQPAFAVTRNLGFDPSSNTEILGVATAPGYPGLGGARRTTLRLAGALQTIARPPGGSPASISVFPGLGSLGGLTFDMPGQSAAFTSAPLTAPVQVTGAPSVRIRVGGAARVTLFAKIYDVDQAGNATLPDQLAAPLQVTGAAAGKEITARLPAIDYDFAAGHRLRLVLTTTDFAYATSRQAATYQVALAGRGLLLPSDPALAVVNGGVPWWTWAAPLAALAAAVLILAAGRRRVPDELVPELAGVPLDITGLTKRYRDGQLAVDRVSLRVERGQILGLLGPNGAGKTTTLRILMGLIHQDAGAVMIFGRPVRPGAPALSRLGSFVEGPGFLPHLSGRANMDLYWRATGRPAADSHLAEVLAIAGLGAAIDRPVRAYSRGMRQRLAIAQAMLGLPDLLVLDEPMNGLDPPQIREMRDVLVQYAADGRTVILSSHMLAEVEQTCTHVVVMGLGRRLAAGPVSEIVGAGSALVVGTTQAQRAVSVLTALDGVEGAERHPDGVLVHPNGVAASAVVAALVQAGIPVDRVMPNRRLEDAFLALIAGPPGTESPGTEPPGTEPPGTEPPGAEPAGGGPPGHADPAHPSGEQKP
jgi:ABC-2 type transport system ATP-binding protein